MEESELSETIFLSKKSGLSSQYVCMIFIVGIVEPEVAGSDCSFYAKMFA